MPLAAEFLVIRLRSENSQISPQMAQIKLTSCITTHLINSNEPQLEALVAIVNLKKSHRQTTSAINLQKLTVGVLRQTMSRSQCLTRKTLSRLSFWSLSQSAVNHTRPQLLIAWLKMPPLTDSVTPQVKCNQVWVNSTSRAESYK